MRGRVTPTAAPKRQPPEHGPGYLLCNNLAGNRAVCIFYALTGQYDERGSNMVFVLAFFAGLMLTLWAIFELGFVKGPERDNRYGSDPLR